jgi:uncharacterized protein (TIGR02270 family)
VIVPAVLQQHADDAAALAAARRALTSAPDVRLERLLRADLRLAANLDGLRLAGAQASGYYDAMREGVSAGALFALTVTALERRDDALLDDLLGIAQAAPDDTPGLLSAFGWVERTRLQGTVRRLLDAADSFRRVVGVAACAVHRVDAGLVAGRWLQDPDARVRARAFRTAGELGLRELVSHCAAVAVADDDEDVRFWAAWAAVLLGDREVALDRLWMAGVTPGRHQRRAFRLALQAMDLARDHERLRAMVDDPQRGRWLVAGSGVVGDPAYVPWLIARMDDGAMARLAGEAFVTMTGASLAGDALDRPAPEDRPAVPGDEPDDPDTAMDPDEDLPWPAGDRVNAWWGLNRDRFKVGTRCFMGGAVTRSHCVHVLKTAPQPQRILAAHYLCLLEPGTPLFNTSAPAWRQQRELAHMD